MACPDVCPFETLPLPQSTDASSAILILQWDACEICFADIDVAHPKHDFVTLRKASDHYRAPKPGSGDFLGRALGLVGSDGAVRHPRVVCDGMSCLFSNL